MEVRLHVIAGPQTGRVFTFNQHETFMIGRSRDAQFCLPEDKYFSRHHCLLEIAPPQCFLRDLNSTNGTFVNEIKVEKAHLVDGDVIQGGETSLRIEVLDDVVSNSDFVNQKTKKTISPSVSVQCLSCEIFNKIEASQSEAKLTYLCENCREKLKNNPQPIQNYQMIRMLGKGGMGTVMLAHRISDGRIVAIKTLLPEVAVSEKSVKRFVREIEIAANLKHPCIVEYIEHGTDNGIVYLVSEYVGGMDASKLAKQKGGKLNYREVVSIIEQILSALEYAHSRGFVHRDIKEQNILVTGDFPNLKAKLTDFGLAKSFRETGMSGITMIGDVAGTIVNMPPEQIRDYKDVRPPSDIYATGMTAYSLLTGKNALDLEPKAGVSETLKAIFEKPSVPLSRRMPEIPNKIAAVIEKSISKEVNARWASAGEMRKELLKASEE